MQFLRTVLVSLACLALSGEAASMKDRSHASAAVSQLLKSQGPGKVDTKTLVASLGEVAKGLQTEDTKALDLAKASESECKKTDQDLTLALNKGKRAFDMATDDFAKTNAQVSALEASLAELKGQIANSNTELDSLQGKLKKMREDKGLLKKGAASALRQVEAVIAKTYLKESNDHHRGPSSLQKKVSSLEELSKSLSLSFLQSDSEEQEEPQEEQAPAEEETQDVTDEVQPAATEEVAPVQKKEQHAPVMILKADKQAVVHASQIAQKGFNEEEKKILDLIEVERKKLQDLEDNMQDLQPAISNKLKQAMEINRTLDAANRGMERDAALQEIEGKKCTVISDNLGAQKKQRTAVVNDVLMASKVLEHMDTGLFLSKDLQGLKRAAPTFLQVNAESFRHSRENAISLLQEGDTSGLEELVENYGSAIQEGPFDSVTKMISGLIASLKAQANEEVNQHQFCQDSLSKNRRDRIAKKNNIDTLTSTIRWSKMAIVRLDDDLKYLEGEVKRLNDAQALESKELTDEKGRVEKEFAEHKLADEVITKAVVILTQLCDLGAASALQEGQTALVQEHRQSSRVGSRFNQCNEAATLLKSASAGVKELDKITKSYLDAFTKLSGDINKDAKSAQDARDTELKSSKAARAERASELATATKDLKEAEKELKLIDDAKSELEHQCSHVETREEKMARRKEEIDALKEALNVLSGEAIPA